LLFDIWLKIKFLDNYFPDLLPGSQAKAGILFLFLGF
jgi:hypothetical protein